MKCAGMIKAHASATAVVNTSARYDQFVKESFKESKDFQLALKQAFESFLNKAGPAPRAEGAAGRSDQSLTR